MVERPTAEHWLELEGRRAFYRTLPAGPAAAAGPPLLLIHGISCCTGTWAPFLKTLATRSDAPAVIVPDLPAHGGSARPPRILDMADFAGWTGRLLDRLNVSRVDVMGHSMGCQVALALAQAATERVGRLVLLGPTTGGRHVSTLRNFLGLTADSTREPLTYNLLLSRVFLRMGPVRYLLTVREMQRDDAFLRARQVAARCVVIQGARDLIVPKRVGQALARALPGAEYAQVPGAAHAAQYSHPERTADAVLPFLGAGRRATPLRGGCSGPRR
jgi:pimeloyl-ACP methyl ester carboxylesterase